MALPLLKLWLLLPLLSTAVLSNPLASPRSHNVSSSNQNFTSTTDVWSTRMIRSIISRQQGLVSSGEVTSTLESGLISLAIQSWLDLYASSSSSSAADEHDQTTANFTGYVDAILQGISATTAFTNVSAAARTPLDRLTVAQAIAGLEREPLSIHDDDGGDDEEGVDGLTQPGIETGGGGGGRQLTADETLALSAMNESLAVQERNQYGGFWYYVYPSWSYLDGTVSFLPFMASPRQRWAPADALLQIQLLYAACHQNATGLLAHGYDASRTAVWADAQTGASPYAWGRSMGWYLMGLVNAWEILTVSSTTPTTTASCADQPDCAALRSTIQSQFAALAHALLRWQDSATGAWWQLPTVPGRAGNYLETSSTALFAFVMFKSIRLGLLSSSSSSSNITTTTTTTTTTIRAAALRAYEYLLASAVVEYPNGTLGYDGTVAVCSLNSTASFDYYTSQPIRSNAPLGEGAFVLASLEVERLGWAGLA